jgi:hypothetical protein
MGGMYMAPKLFGTEHILYIIITTLIAAVCLLLCKKRADTERSQKTVLQVLAALLLVAIVTNRLSQVFRYGQVRWYCIIPDSICGMTSFLLSLGVLLGKKSNNILHFTWLLALFGGIATVIYATFIDQDISFFYLPTISGLLHHSLSATLAVALLLFGYIDISYKKWYCTFFGFTAYVTLGAFLMQTFQMSDAFHIAEPLIPGTPLTIWVMAPMYAVGYGLLLLIVEIVKRKKAVSPTTV